ncbi:unnamed protein product [Oppiella nova]|uniref:RRM domain-containing protein n=1 Tax=Oppiella nova TaxID=334625 RepID=A0A7R9MVK8_9ACAR|nr:unnamed protein product [Oppiella nova]CAD7666044.1 unnamed protein product [Oppiella nova]CAG2174867.1 unnamed protein product [Oppiella nova]CAG2183172.1 unnamed protein product [Oppiella nova]
MINDDDLRNFFTKFGKILDVRINRQNQKQGNNNKTPNYGFVTFENPDIVQQILKQKPIYFENHRFNVEEKRSQSGRGSMSYERNPNREPRPGGMGGGSGGRMNNPMGMRPQNDRPSGGNPRNRNPFNPGGGPRGPGGPASGGGGFGAPNRNNSFNNRQNQR